jgi:hypothetical protein
VTRRSMRVEHEYTRGGDLICCWAPHSAPSRRLVGEMRKHARKTTSDSHGGQLAVDVRVVVYPGTNAESHGIVVDDFGEAAGYPRRWAVRLDSGELVSVDSDSLAVK